MNGLINIFDCQIYVYTIDQTIEQCSQKDRCDLVVDENYIDEFIAQSKRIVVKLLSEVS
jgi:hypothetical protein|tara:strand:- start:9748 stop:9924 length:177 start_codon:yes stop_codon:yes gene_type:complete